MPKLKGPPPDYPDAPESDEDDYHQYPSYTRVPRDRLDFIVDLLEQQYPTRTIIKKIMARDGVSYPAARKNVEHAFQYMTDLAGAEKPWRREQLLAGLRDIYLQSMEQADIDEFLQKLNNFPNMKYEDALKIFARFNPDKSRANALRALDQMAKIIGAYEAESVNVTVTEELSPADRQKRILEILSRARPQTQNPESEAPTRVLDYIEEEKPKN